MEWVGCIRCEKFLNNFLAQTCALIAPVQLVLQWVSCSNETLPNAPKHYETHTNMSLGSNGVDWVHSLRKILMRLHGTNICINCTSSTRFAPSFVLRNIAKCTKTLRNAPEYEFGSNGVDWVRSLRKIRMRFYGTNLCINCTSSTRSALSFMW